MSDIKPLTEGIALPSHMIYGPPGTGKTTFVADIALGLFKARKKKTLFLDLDYKLTSQENLSREHREAIDIWLPSTPLSGSKIEISLVSSGKGAPPKMNNGYREAVKLLNDLQEHGPFDYAAICVDSGTALFEYLERMMLSFASEEAMTQPMWGHFATNIQNFATGFVSMPCKTFLIFHAADEKDDLTGRVKTSITLRGNQRFQLSKRFSEIYYFEGADTGSSFTAVTLGNDRKPARSGYNDVPKPKAKLSEIQAAILKRA